MYIIRYHLSWNEKLVKIVTDSTSDLTSQTASELAITVVPLFVNFGIESFRDGIDLGTEDFYKKLSESTILPTTASPNINSFTEIFDKLSEETDEILAITISSKLSATYETAVKAKGLWQGRAKIEIIDSEPAIVGLALIVISAAKAAKDGASMDEVIALTRNNIKLVDFRVAFDTLEYLKKGGRIGTAQAFLGSMLHLHPVLTIKNGVTEGVTRLRSRAKVLEYLYNFALSFPNVNEIAIEDATTPDEAELLMERLSPKFTENYIYRTKISPVIGTHVGPHVLGIGILPRN
jgi:DegV family protein with EDD domain